MEDEALEKNLQERFMTHTQVCSASKAEEEQEFGLYLDYETSCRFTALDEMDRTWRIPGGDEECILNHNGKLEGTELFEHSTYT